MTTSKLFGVSGEVAKALKLMPHIEYLEIGICLMNRIQVKTVKAVQDADFKYRAKAISNYEKWLKEDGNEHM